MRVMKKIYLSLLLVCLSALGINAIAQTTSYTTVGTYTFTVGSGYSAVTIDMAGAQGGTSYYGSPGGLGGRVQCILNVTTGQVLTVYVGGAGSNYNLGTTSGGANGGGGGAGGGIGYYYGAGGGGSSDIRTGGTALTNRVVVAGAGGGGGNNCADVTSVGGFGGGLVAGTGQDCSTPVETYCGQGGSQTAGGLGATGYSAPAGTFGAGAGWTSYSYSGGGGGGWYGGGAAAYGGGGGGSSYTGTGTSAVVHTTGYRTGNGYVNITPLPPTITATPTSLAFGGVTTGTASTPQVLNLNGIALSGANVTVTPPANFQVSPDGATWYTSSSPYTFSYTGSSFSNFLFVQFLPTAVSAYSGNIAVTGGGISATLNIPVTGTGSTACSGTPTAGTATINGVATASGGSSTVFTLNVPGATLAGGITYQWQVSTTSGAGPWTNIPSGVTASYAYSGLSGNSWFQCIVSCGGSSATSTAVSATFTLAATSCSTPTFASASAACSSYFMWMRIQSLTGISGTSIADATACTGTGYENMTGSMSVRLNSGTTYSCTLNTGTSYPSSMGAQVWIDFNNNGIFEASESVGGYTLSSTSATSPVISLVIPAGVPSGAFRMRVVGNYNCCGATSYPGMNPCPTTAITYGDVRDYVAVIAPSAPILTATPLAPFSNVTVGSSSVPVEFTTLNGSLLSPGLGFVTVTAPTGFQLSTSGTTWANTALVPYSGSTISNQNVYVQFNPTSAITYTGNLSVTGGAIVTPVTVSVTGTGTATACSGTPTPGTATVSPTTGGATTTFTLSLTGTSTSGGLMYQWQSSPDGTTWTNVPNGFYPVCTYTGIYFTMQFRCLVSCGTGTAAISTTATATYVAGTPAASSCTPTFSSASAACSSYSMWMRIQALTGVSGTSIADATACTGTGWEDMSGSMTVTLNASSTYSCTLNTGGSYPGSMGAQVWIDFNNNGTFEASESVGGYALSSTSSTSPVITLTIPAGVPSGAFRMRVVGNYNCCGATSYPAMNPCPTTAITYGDVRDYRCVINGSAAPCTGPTVGGIVSATPLNSCTAFNANVFNVGESVTGTGLTFQWQSSTSPTSGFTSIAGATNSAYIPNISAVGTLYFRDIVTCTPSGTSAVSNPLGLTLNAAPTAIVGPSAICMGTSPTLTSTPAGGTWSSSNPAIFTIGSGTGTITTVSAGVSTATYTLSSGCTAVLTITVNPQPGTITGSNTVCGSLSTTLSCSPGGGTWTSSASTIASVGTSSGVVTGGAAGTAIISYTLPTGCSSTFPMTVNALSAITGTPSMCNGYTTTLADATPGGTWSSTNLSVATVNTSGVVSSVSVGTTTISYFIAGTGCAATISVAVTNPPTYFTITGGGSACPGGSVAVGLAGSNAGLAYTLYNGTTPILPPITGAGFAFNFPSSYTTTSGIYSVIAANGTPCATNMIGTVNVTINPLPTPYTVSTSGSGSYCAGGSGVHVFLNSSQIGVNYQLFIGSTPVGTAIAGTSAALDFGLQTAAGVYSVTGYNTSTTCGGPMSNTVNITINPTPTSYAVLPVSGGYCTGGTGVNVSLAGSVSGINYQLQLSGVATGSVVSGTGALIPFGLQTIPGTYTVLATNPATGCTSLMTGSSIVTVNPLPATFTMTGGGGICASGSGADVQLNGSQAGVNYQLFRGGIAITTMAGTGSALDYGLQTTPGSYTVVATNPSTLCTSNMSGSANVFLNPSPASFAVTEAATGYCSGGAGVHIGLSGSVSGTNYQLWVGTTLTGAASGTGAALDFGSMTIAGTYSVIASIAATGCSGPMAGTQTIVINPLPNLYTVSVAGGGLYCAGGAGQIISLSGSQVGINYQLYRGGVLVGTPIAGTGTGFNFPSQTVAGTYTVVATNTLTLCTNTMTGSAVIIINPAPTVYNVTGGGGYCAGGAGNHIGLSASDIGVNYQLYNSGTLSGAPVSGLGGTLDFGSLTSAGTYTVIATNAATTCTANMASSAIISINPLPAVNNMVSTGSTSFCAGGSGVTIGLNGSVTGINYNLYNGTTLSGAAVAGSGSPITFGSVTSPGAYTATATNPVTGCTNNMTGTITVAMLPVPTAYNVTGGGGYCIGGAGVHVNLSNSQPGKKYQLFSTSGPVTGAVLNGTGFALDFGAQTVASTYTVIATDTATLCTNNMTGSATISINPLPSAFAVAGGGNYCAGAAGPHVTLSSSQIGMLYQLFVGGVPTGAPASGTGSLIDFGAQTTAGTYTITSTNSTTGCTVVMTGTITIGVNPAPTAFTVTGGGNVCPGGAGAHVGISNSLAGTVYQLYNGSTMVGTALAGIGTALDFGLQTATGTYTVVATNLATGCTGPMTGSVTIGVASLPVVYNVTGSTNYCPGGSGAHVGLSGSSTGVTYQLFRGGSAVGTPFSGTGSALDFGIWTSGTYTVVATTTATTCTNNMTGSAIIGISPLPALHTVTGGGNYCTGGTGVHVGLDGSTLSTWYQLYNGSTMIGAPVAGTGGSLDFGLQTASGTYTVMANSTTTTCASGMTGSVVVGTNPLPGTFAVSGGGNFCIGGTGVDVSLSGSETGISYQLYNGSTMVGSAIAGTGSAIDFGMHTVAGTYTVVGSNSTTFCTNNMSGSAAVVVNSLPNSYTVTGGGNYCTGSGGAHVMLSGSDVGITYQLYHGGSAVSGPMAGTGFGLDFGLQTASGSYTVVASNPVTTCTSNMTGSVSIAISPLPTAYTLSGSGTSYCAGGAGIDITLSGSDIGTNYQLYNGTAAVGGSVAGTSAAIDFGYHTGTGTYSVVAINTSTTCSSNMGSTVSVTIGSLPVAYTITGGGNYCTGGSGVHIGLSGSNTGVTYQLFQGTTAVGGPMTGTGTGLDFGLLTTGGTYTIVGTKIGTTCTNNMAGSVTINTVALPAAYTVTGGGAFCATGTGVHVGLSGSASGITYQLYVGGVATGIAVPGTGMPIDFGFKTVGGSYTVMATNMSSGCSNNMTGSVIVVAESLPAAYPVNGGGNYCPGGSGVHIGLLGSVTGINYQLYNGTAPVGTALSGTGSSLDFGLNTAAGTYTVVASSGTTGCTSNMTGSVVVGINSLPNAYTVAGGGNYCSGTGGVHVGLDGSDAGISYQAYNSFAMVGSAVIGTGGPLDMGLVTVTGTYTVIGTDISTTCSNNMAGSVPVVEVMTVTPVVSISSSGGDIMCSGVLNNFSAVVVNGGTDRKSVV